MTTTMKISLNTSKYNITKFIPYEMKNKDIVTYLHIWSNEIFLFHCIMEVWMYVFVPGFLLPIEGMK